MTARELPPAEWSRLIGTELETVWHKLSPAWCRVLVVEDDDGQIIGTWTLQTWVHVEGFGIAAGHRSKGAVFRRLLTEMKRWLDGLGIKAVLTGATTDEIRSFLMRLHASPLPGETFVWPVEKLTPQQESVLCQPPL